MVAPSYPDYTQCLVNLANSILSHFGVATYHATLPEADEALARGPSNVVLLVLDGLGKSTLERQLPPESFLRSHLLRYYSSVFPPTTTAATVSLLSGRTPIEHGWLGWDLYFPEVDHNVTLFLNTLSGTNTLVARESLVWGRFPYQSILERIMEAGHHAYFSSPHQMPHPRNLQEVLERTERLCTLPQRKFIYAYIDQPDGIQHRKGCFSHKCHQELVRIDSLVGDFCARLEDAVVFVTADHGHLDIAGKALESHPEIAECLTRAPSMEARALDLSVKTGWEEEFEQRFHEAFGDEFAIMSWEQALAHGLFGPGQPHPGLTGVLGSHLAISVGRCALFNTDQRRRSYVGHHAGLTADELEIPLIVVDC